MPARLLPLFPLRAVVFPQAEFPLHIFEDRYKEMVGEAIRNGTEFGIVLARGESIAGQGCTVTIEKVVNRYEDGRLDIITRGRRRFEILNLNDERSYLQGEVEFFDDDESGPAAPELCSKALTQYRTLIESSRHSAEEPPANDPHLSFRLAQPIADLDFLQTLLAMRSESERLKQLASFLSTYVPRLRITARMGEVAPLNGHGQHLPGL